MKRILLRIAQIVRRLRVVNSFIKATKNPYQSQTRFLFRIIKENRDTEFGKRHYFSKIKTIDDFQKFVPIRKYEELEKDLTEIKGKGKQNVLTRDEVLMFGMTSGTTDEPKFIPITKPFIKQYQKDWDIWIYFAFKDHPHMFDGKVLTMVAPEKVGYTISGIPYGSISGVINNNQTKIIKHFFCLPYCVYTIKDYDAKYYTILRIAVENNIGTIVTPNPSMILLLCKKINEYKEEIISDIENGTLSKKYVIEAQVRKEIEKYLKPNPKRARDLMRQDKKYRGLYPKDIWSKLALIGCWKEGTLPLYLRQFPRYFGTTPIRDIGLIATEGQSSVPLSDDAKGGVLLTNSLFFEFIEIHDINKTNKKIYLSWEIEIDKEYFLIITPQNGLYRYFTNDIVRVIGYYNKTPVIQFLHKGEHVASLTGEKITEWQVVHAMRYATEKLGVPVDGFTLCAHFGTTPRYDLLLELYRNCHVQKLKKLIVLFDAILKKDNVEYKEKRDSERLGMPQIWLMDKDDYAKLRRAKTESGAHDAQVKIPSLTGDPDFEKQFSIKEVIRA